MVPVYTFHLVSAEEFSASDERLPYAPSAFAADGFIHCTDDADELANVGNRYYRYDPRPYLILVLHTGSITSPVVYEDAGRLYPHIYGPLNRDAIISVVPARRNPDGRFLVTDVGTLERT